MPKTFTVPELVKLFEKHGVPDDKLSEGYRDTESTLSYRCGYYDATTTLLKELYKLNKENINGHTS